MGAIGIASLDPHIDEKMAKNILRHANLDYKSTVDVREKSTDIVLVFNYNDRYALIHYRDIPNELFIYDPENKKDYRYCKCIFTQTRNLMEYWKKDILSNTFPCPICYAKRLYK